MSIVKQGFVLSDEALFYYKRKRSGTIKIKNALLCA